jgi:pseudo-rSAM protein
VTDISLVQDISVPFSVTAFVFSEENYKQLLDTFDTDYFLDKNIRYIPLYDNENLSFFESNIFIDKDELAQIKLSKDEVFMRQSLNIGDFGKLTIMPDGMVYANVYYSPLGSINHSPYSIVYKEFTEGQSWFRFRDQEPCSDCMYQWLCPSPSNYEMVMGRPNLCHIRP